MCMCNPSLRTPWCPKCKPFYPSYQEQQEREAAQKSHDLINLYKAHRFANETSDCAKVKVGALVVDQHSRGFFGANRTMPEGCNNSCQVTGHCVSTIHAEIDAIVRSKTNLYMGTIYVTRYPCAACARAIVTAGITTVVYGRERPISTETQLILQGVTVRHVPEFDEKE